MWQVATRIRDSPATGSGEWLQACNRLLYTPWPESLVISRRLASALGNLKRTDQLEDLTLRLIRLEDMDWIQLAQDRD
jgi:hypothetical protein